MRIYHRSQRYFGAEQLDQRLRHGLVGYWKFNEGSGLTACDLSGKRNHGTLINGPKWSLGREHIGNALSFDGVDDYVDCGENIRPVSAISISAWLKPITFQPAGAAISAGRSGGYMLFYPSDPDVKFYVYTTAWQSISIPQADISLNNWHQFILTYDQTNLKVFMNGVEKKSIPLSGDITYDDKPCIIGGYVSATPPYAPTECFKGLIDEVRIYNRALSPAEIVLFASPSFSPVVPVRRYIEGVIIHIRGWWSK